MHTPLLEFICLFWLGLVLPTLSMTIASITVMMSLLSIWILKLYRRGRPSFYILAFSLGILWSPEKQSAPEQSTWEIANCTAKVVRVEPQDKAHVRAWCKINTVKNSWGHHLDNLAGYNISVSLPCDNLHPNSLETLRWDLEGKIKINARSKVRFKMAYAEPLPIHGVIERIQLMGLNIALQWQKHLQSFKRENSSPSMGQSLLLSMLGGERASARVDFILQRMGLGHLTAISGLHFALVTSLVFWLLARLYTPYRLIGSALASTLFLVASGISPSALRAWTMGLFATLCLLQGRRYFAMHSLAITCGFWLLVNPSWSLAPGFILSVICTAIIIAMAPVLSSPQNNRFFYAKIIVPWLSLQGAIFFFTAFLQLYWFHSISWISLPSNLLAAPLLAFCFCLALVASLIGAASHRLGEFVFTISSTCADFILQFLSELPNRLDQPLNYELSSDWLASFLPWTLGFLLKLTEVDQKTPSSQKPTSEPLSKITSEGNYI